MALNEHTPGTPAGSERDPLLDRAYRGAATDEPPARLDAAILAAARREAGARPRPLGAVLRAWRVPVSIAAVVVLSVSLVTLVREEEGAEMDQRAQPRQERKLESARAPAAPEAKAPAAGPALRDDAGGARQDAPVALSKSAEPAAAPLIQGAPGAPAASEKREPDATASTDAVHGTGAAERSAPLMAAKPAAAPEARREKADSTSGRLAAEDQQPVWRGYEQEPALKWLERIEELRRLGQKVEADAMLAEFKRRFPDHPLPPGWR